MQKENLFHIKTLLQSVVISLFFSFYILNGEAPLSEYDILPMYDDPMFSDMYLDDISYIDEALENYLDESAGVKKNINPIVILILFKEINVLQFLQQPFFLQTRMLFQKNGLDDPLIDPTTIIQRQRTALYMPSVFFEYLKTADDFFEKYFALTAPTFVGAIKQIIETLNPALLDQFDVDTIFDIISQTTVHQRRVGASCLATHASENYCLRALFLLQYVERNFFLSEKNKEQLFEELGIPPSNDTTFTNNHLVSDQIGFGNVRFEFETIAIKNLTNSIDIGGFFDIPTAFALKKGIIGRNFPALSTLPTFDINLLSSSSNQGETNSETSQFLTNFFLDALDRISADLLHTNLGNNSYNIGLGFFLRTKTRLSHFLEGAWTHRIVFKNNISLEYLTPANQEVFYAAKIDSNELESISLDAIIDSGNEDLQIETVNFIERKIVEKFFLRAFSTLVQPGFVFRWASLINFLLTEKSKLGIGSEFFYKGNDIILHVNAPRDVKKTLNTQIANIRSGRETSFFAKYSYAWEREDFNADFFIALKATVSTDKNTLTGYEGVLGWKVEF